ncbi:hypothetical protein [Enterobacter mori]|uniref:hypothetical protein n=1 Tax=Enterobacter mori TaxID=539813 RepID=UPI00223654D4|nr:hypothetical protein [Enterobacter mori]MCW4990119.1 hypothetical protein [Enterobacter mori]
MHILLDQFPQVWVSAAPSSTWEAELDALLSRGERFILLTRNLPDKEHSSSTEKKAFALWFKRNRKRLAEVCSGSIVIVPNERVATGLAPLVAPLCKAFGFPVRVVTEERLEGEIARLTGEC